MVERKINQGHVEENPKVALDDEARLNRILESSTWSSQFELDRTALPENSLGTRVKAKRLIMGLNHDGLSDVTKIVDTEGRGISRTTIRGYELGTYKPGARELRILTLALEVSPNWLLFGGSTDPGSTLGAATSLPPEKPRWADVVIPLISYSQLATSERKQVRDLIETLYRLQIGEVRFRSMRAFVEDFADTIQDAVRDAKEANTLEPMHFRKVFVDTAASLRAKYGDEEANLLLAMVEPLLAIISDVAAKTSERPSSA